MVVRELDELLDIVVPLLGELDDLVNVLVARLLVLLGGETLADLLGLLQLLVLLHGQWSNASLDTNKLQETTLLELTPLGGIGVWWWGGRASINWWGISRSRVVVRVRVMVVLVVLVTRGVLTVTMAVRVTGVQHFVLATAQRGASTWGRRRRWGDGLSVNCSRMGVRVRVAAVLSMLSRNVLSRNVLSRDVVVRMTVVTMGNVGNRGSKICLGRRWCSLVVDGRIEGSTCRKVIVRVREGRDGSSKGGDKDDGNFGRHDDFNCKVGSD
jgi:hypothetical protein